MRRALPVLAILSVLAPAHAQTTSPEVTSMALPLVLSGALDRRSEMGCSQSFASDQGTAQLSLAVDASGAARLTLDGDRHITSGPSFGRYQAGDHEFSRVHELHRSLWSGRASIVAGAVLVTFDRVDAAEMRIQGEGTLPLPAPTSSAFRGQLQCHLERVDVLPATPAVGEVPTSTSLLRCGWVGTAPAPFDGYSDGTPWAIGAGAGVENRSDEGMLSGGPRREIRRR